MTNRFVSLSDDIEITDVGSVVKFVRLEKSGTSEGGYKRSIDVSSTDYYSSRGPSGRNEVRRMFKHLPGKHNQKEHGRKTDKERSDELLGKTSKLQINASGETLRTIKSVLSRIPADDVELLRSIESMSSIDKIDSVIAATFRESDDVVGVAVGTLGEVYLMPSRLKKYDPVMLEITIGHEIGHVVAAKYPSMVKRFNSEITGTRDFLRFMIDNPWIGGYVKRIQPEERFVEFYAYAHLQPDRAKAYPQLYKFFEANGTSQIEKSSKQSVILLSHVKQWSKLFDGEQVVKSPVEYNDGVSNYDTNLLYEIETQGANIDDVFWYDHKEEILQFEKDGLVETLDVGGYGQLGTAYRTLKLTPKGRLMMLIGRREATNLNF